MAPFLVSQVTALFSVYLSPAVSKGKKNRQRERERERERRVAEMECVFGLVGDGFALVVADSSAVHSILVHKSNEDKIMVLDSHKLLGASGEGGDRFVFSLIGDFLLGSWENRGKI